MVGWLVSRCSRPAEPALGLGIPSSAGEAQTRTVRGHRFLFLGGSAATFSFTSVHGTGATSEGRPVAVCAMTRLVAPKEKAPADLTRLGYRAPRLMDSPCSATRPSCASARSTPASSRSLRGAQQPHERPAVYRWFGVRHPCGRGRVQPHRRVRPADPRQRPDVALPAVRARRRCHPGMHDRPYQVRLATDGRAALVWAVTKR